jgi:DDE superfamily endonuclease
LASAVSAGRDRRACGFGYEGSACRLSIGKRSRLGCWAPEEAQIAAGQNSGRDRLNIHGAIDLETGRTRMIEALSVNAQSTIALFIAIMAMYPAKKLIHVFSIMPNTTRLRWVQEWLARPDCRFRRHFIPAYCPHLNPIDGFGG